MEVPGDLPEKVSTYLITDRTVPKVLIVYQTHQYTAKNSFTDGRPVQSGVVPLVQSSVVKYVVISFTSIFYIKSRALVRYT